MLERTCGSRFHCFLNLSLYLSALSLLLKGLNTVFIVSCTFSIFEYLVQLFATPWTVACQAPLSMGILQERILEWVAMPSSRESSTPRDQTRISCIAARIFTTEPSRIPYMGNRWINKHDILFDKRYNTHNTPGYCIFSLQLLCHSLSHPCRRMGMVHSLSVSH